MIRAEYQKVFSALFSDLPVSSGVANRCMVLSRPSRGTLVHGGGKVVVKRYSSNRLPHAVRGC